MEEIIKKYTNGEVTIIWKPAVCIHSKICWNRINGLPEVFNPAVRPWIKPEAAATGRIVDQISKCPSGALSYYYNGAEEAKGTEAPAETRIDVIAKGPLLIYGNLSITHADGTVTQKNKITALCRCGLSANKPYCDGTHITAAFEG